MDGYVRAMCMKLAELSLSKEGVTTTICDFAITVTNYLYENGEVETLYYDNINFTDDNAEQRIEKALDYVRDLGGNKDGR